MNELKAKCMGDENCLGITYTIDMTIEGEGDMYNMNDCNRK